MIPSVLAQHVERGVKDFLRTTFPVTTPFFSKILENILQEPGGIFKGPYLQIQLPFQRGKGEGDFFSISPLHYQPYLHQEQAFERLSGVSPSSTIVATGTGSGKTECFLYPILDYCYRQRGKKGIKAILIYPMNALATDQAGRLAKLICNSKLNGHIRAGMYIGQSEKNPSQSMSVDRLITDRNTLRLNPPDILLTNYRMLDFLLMRPVDRPLWQYNTPETLRYLVVDELHTFDGAQGSDLGCLIRRLKGRLAIEPDTLCCIGTSATLGGDEEKKDLLEYASLVFGERFSHDSVVNEFRLNATEFLEGCVISRAEIPPDGDDTLKPETHNEYREYIRAQHRLWLGEEIQGDFQDSGWRIDLASKLGEHLFFQNLIRALGGEIYSFKKTFDRLEKVTKSLKGARREYKFHLLESLLSLISEARREVITQRADGTSKSSLQPFLNVRIQLWMRELRRMVSEVKNPPRLRFSDDLNSDQLKKHLPLVHCRECGSMGWAGLKRKNSTAIMGYLPEFYYAFFHHDPKVVYLFPERESDITGDLYDLCPDCLHITADAHDCPNCNQTKLIPVYMPDSCKQKKNRQISTHDCPDCYSQNSLTLLGSRAASLTSVMIVQLFSSPYNDDKKLLTFSDNVQDAAHRAGFFNSRTFRFNFRTALQRVILNGGNGKTLAEMPGIFDKYWSSAMDQNQFIATFLAPNMEWLKDYAQLLKSGFLSEDSDLLALVRKRIGWEILSEYGFRARIGRTLEKTGSSVAHLDPEKLEGVLETMIEPLRNEIGQFAGLDKDRLRQFILGFMIHLKNQGGIVHPELESYIESCGNTFLLNKKIWMANFGPQSRAPAFLTNKRGNRFDPIYSRSQTRKTWYLSWAEKCFLHLTPTILSVSRELYDLVLKFLVKEGVLEEIPCKGHYLAWGIRPEVLRVSYSVCQLRCQKCGHNLSVAEVEGPFFKDSPCQRFNCPGKYEPFDSQADYYGMLYETGDVQRIFSREHTGLLKRDVREDLEICFKASPADRKPWYPNLLSCTPTLEMGIDIGNLSSLILCSVPPAQTNYLQRIGRAGRRDGNALNLTVANARPHDLYFYAEPEEMIAGIVNAPGVFLDASAVLERQLTAFCFDRWVATDEKAIVPPTLKAVLTNLAKVDGKRFPHNLIDYIETNQVDLLEGFFSLFEKSHSPLSPESKKYLRDFMDGDESLQGSLRYRIMNGLHSRYKERESFKKKVKILNTKIRKRQKGPEYKKDKKYEDELRGLNIEKSALQELIKSISDCNTFNFFTDEGLLPNYAFPQAGVMLNSLIYRKKGMVQVGEGSYDTWSYEYERPAVSALQELAPENTFYAEGRRVKVDQVDMTVSEVESWRFCNNCSHRELLGKEDERESCVKCGSPMWSDAGQKRLMLRMRQVFASTSDKNSRISDDSDNREPVFYNKQMLVEFDEKQVIEAFKFSADYPFGFDFLSKVDFCEINFGEKSEMGDKVAIAGEEMPRKGFALCRVCGKVQSKNDDPSHAYTCTSRNQKSDKPMIDCLYLYRQFVSEAIRILLPISIISESNRNLQSFIAAVQLGLKKRFKGKIDHLQTTIHEEPLPGTSFKRKYLVLYDTVPGGTGYLKQLMSSGEQLLGVFERSLAALRSCSCNQEDDKDGCYRCLFAYRNSYSMSDISRTTAIELLAEILKYADRLEKTDSLQNISFNTYIESELEARFLGVLKGCSTSERQVSIKRDLVNGKPGYFMKVADQAYFIEPQVHLDDSKGVRIPSRADFLISPARGRDKKKPIAVFLDGFTYHKKRIGLDMAQRMAIVQSKKYHIWSLGWHDVENKFKPKGNYYTDYLETSDLPAGANFSALMKGYKIEEFKKYHRLNSFDLLLTFLESPEEENWKLFSFVLSLLYLDHKKFQGQDAIDQWKKEIEKSFPYEIAQKMTELVSPCLYGAVEPTSSGGDSFLWEFAALQSASAKPPDPLGVRFGCHLHDSEQNKQKPLFQAAWNGFLRLFNLFQFLPHAYFVTTGGINEGAYETLELDREPLFQVGNAPKTAEDGEWESVKEDTEPSIYELLDKLKDAGWPVPEAGYELMDSEGEIIASAELGWEKLKAAFLRDEEVNSESKFTGEGWRVVPLREVIKNPDEYLSLKDREREENEQKE